MNKKILLTLALVSGFALAMRKSPRSIATARANAQKLIGQMKPGSTNFNALADQVRAIVANLRAIKENKIASGLQIALDAKIHANTDKIKRSLKGKIAGDTADFDQLVKAYEAEIKAKDAVIAEWNTYGAMKAKEIEKLQAILDQLVSTYKDRGYTAAWAGQMVDILENDYDSTIRK